jgi:hypothetical protein
VGILARIEAWIPTELANRLALALNEIVPDDVALAATPEGAIKIIAGEGDGWSEVLPYPPVETFAVQVLATLQDDVMEFVAKDCWPPSDPARPEAAQHAAYLPQPHAEIVGDELHCWFGSRQDPALRVPPVRL